MSASLAPSDLLFSVDTVWELISGCLVFFMGAGFSMLEAGTVPSTSNISVVVKNLLDMCVTAMGWYFTGFAWGFGPDCGNGFIGTAYYFGTDMDQSNEDLTTFFENGASSLPLRDWFFQWAFCYVAATIAGGAVSGRARAWGFALASFFMAAWVYPLITHWAWGPNGWLQTYFQLSYVDTAGSGVVHVTGGTSALVGAVIAGNRKTTHTPASNVPLAALGTLILWFGWYGFNAGSVRITSLAMLGQVAHVCCNNTLAAAAGALGAIWSRNILNRTFQVDVGALLNGALAGLVAITGPCARVDMWAAAVIGLVSGPVFVLTSVLESKAGIDDPVEAAPLHLGAGAWGVIAAGLLDQDHGLFIVGDGYLLGVQMVGLLVLIGWTAANMYVAYSVLKFFNILLMGRSARVTRRKSADGSVMEDSVDMENQDMYEFGMGAFMQ